MINSIQKSQNTPAFKARYAIIGSHKPCEEKLLQIGETINKIGTNKDLAVFNLSGSHDSMNESHHFCFATTTLDYYKDFFVKGSQKTKSDIELIEHKEMPPFSKRNEYLDSNLENLNKIVENLKQRPELKKDMH